MMTKLLVSVREADEVKFPYCDTIGIVDIKEPNQGSLGRATEKVVKEIKSRLDSRYQVSVALGELNDFKQSFDWNQVAFNGVRFAKFGLSQMGNDREWRRKWFDAIQTFPVNVSPVSVVYADWKEAETPEPMEIIEFGAKIGAGAMLVDTFQKSEGSLFQILDSQVDVLTGWIRAARQLGMRVVLAGGIKEAELPMAFELEPDLIGVRGAICRTNRESGVCSYKLREFLSQFRLLQMSSFNHDIRSANIY